MDENIREFTNNSFRVTKKRGTISSTINIPGGYLNATYLTKLQEIAQKYGDGTIYITLNQSIEIPGINVDDMPQVNDIIKEIVDEIDQEQGKINITACVGNKVCPYASFDTYALAKKIENHIYPNEYNIKVAISGCQNDCAKVRTNDIGIIGMTRPIFDSSRCVSCGACMKICYKKASGAIRFVYNMPKIDVEKCIGCGECILACPNFAWTRKNKRYYKVTVFGMSDKENTNVGQDLIQWVDEETVLSIITNIQEFFRESITETKPDKNYFKDLKENMDFEEFKKIALKIPL